MPREDFLRSNGADPSEVETFDPDLGPGRPAAPRRPRKKWKEVADTRPMPRLDPDVYSTKKSVAQGFMDVALLSANADQLRTLLKTGDSNSPFYVACMVFISLSLIVQVMIAVCLLVKMRYNINRPDHFRRAETLNNICMIASVFLTTFNVLITSFMAEVPGVTEVLSVNEVETLPNFPRDAIDSAEPVVG
ncbi:ninjurin-2-like [Pollicipes pollicipes]|uniref:ninjurin-2-like n=1 Tax=Pollicipes pollicipes TaxID=41117 RepID=UPI00188529B9|nr:ninjurin-2-like [Pollicipes pollicipes]XP_037093229.1 ninjurin-2-like [Pollicipes pollicipes]